MNLMKLLVTGGAGYIGSHAVKALLEKGEKVVVVDNLFRGYKKPIEVLQEKFSPENLVFYQGDLGDKPFIQEVLKKEKPTGVLHFAALCLVNESMENPGLYFRNNVLGTLNLLEAMVEEKIDRLVFSSTCAVYGEAQYLPVDENHPLNPTNPYGESKLVAEKMIKWFGQIYGLRYAVLRYFNVAGAASDGLIGDSKKPSQLLVQNAVRGALGIEEFKLTCPKVETPDGTPIRDYINIEDLIEAHLAALKFLEEKKESQIFNLGTGRGNSVLEIVKTVQKVTGKSFPVKEGEARKGEYAQIYADNTKAKSLLSWEPKRSLEQTISSLVLWYQKHPRGWEY